MSTTNPIPAMTPTTRRVRAYFAPVNRVQQQPTLFDPSLSAGFALATPPAPWIDLGWIESFARKSASKYGALATGSPASTQYQVRETLDATVSLRFTAWSKLTMALAAGSQHMNVIAAAPPPSGTGNGSGSKGVTSVSLAASGSTATFLALTSATTFVAGAFVTVDVDYAGQTGFVGSGVSAAYVSSAAAVNSDPDYIRRVSFNVARVQSVSPSGLTLAQPLLAGVPSASMRVQPLVGFVDREGGSFFQEWSALFVVAGDQGERVFFHYPRLQAMSGAAEAATPLVAPVERVSLAASFRALPVTDANDGEQVVCFRTFVPGPAALV
jgi:hypothetical protein